jgi:hypothetical protein
VPYAFDDAQGERVDRRSADLDALVALARADGAPLTVRISPSSGSVARFAVERLLATVPDDVWIGSLSDYARFYAARASLALRVDVNAHGYGIGLVGHGQVPAQTLILPFAARTATVRGTGQALTITAAGHRIAVPAFTDRIDLDLAPAAAR